MMPKSACRGHGSACVWPTSNLNLILKALTKLDGFVDFMSFAQKTSKIPHICGKTFPAFEIACKSFIF
jgi:hypothetical protein